MFQTGLGQVFCLACSALLLFPSGALEARAPGGKKASLSLKANPAVSFAPARVVVVAELKGGSDEDESLYCPTVEWEWDDGTYSTAEADCDPFEPGKSPVKRRYTGTHQYKMPGTFKIYLRLKKGERVALAGNSSIQVRPGLGYPPGEQR